MDTDQRVQTILSDMVNKNQVRVLSIDFDATIIQVHTYGAWRGTAEELSMHVRPVFVSILKQALAFLDNGLLYVSVVTFSSQAKLIRKVLSIVLGNDELAKKIIIRCNDFKWDWPSGFEQAGKQGHIGSVLQHIHTSSQLQIPLSQVMLIDDDTRNIDIAKESGIRTTVFPVITIPEKGKSDYEAVVTEGNQLVEVFLDDFETSCSIPPLP